MEDRLGQVGTGARRRGAAVIRVLPHTCGPHEQCGSRSEESGGDLDIQLPLGVAF